MNHIITCVRIDGVVVARWKIQMRQQKSGKRSRPVDFVRGKQNGMSHCGVNDGVKDDEAMIGLLILTLGI